MANLHVRNQPSEFLEANEPVTHRHPNSVPWARERSKVILESVEDQDPHGLCKIALEKRVIIIEGISGSGKDSFQAYLKRKLRDRAVYDFSEGEVLHSWKQLQIEGISQLRVRFMKLLVHYIKQTLSKDENIVFLLNRFHLSTYFSTIARYPRLAKAYGEVINGLRELPVHIFILLLDKEEIEVRGRHPERSNAWRRHQREIVNKEGFSDTLRRHIWQQELILKAARQQGLPFSLIKMEIKAGNPVHWVLLEHVNGNGAIVVPAPKSVDAAASIKGRALRPQQAKATV